MRLKPILRVNLEGLLAAFALVLVAVSVALQLSTRAVLSGGFKDAVDELVRDSLTSECVNTRTAVEAAVSPAVRHDWLEATLYDHAPPPLSLEDTTKYALHAAQVSHTGWEFVYASYQYAAGQWGFSGWHRNQGAAEPDYWYWTDAAGICRGYLGATPETLEMSTPIFEFPIDAVDDEYVTAPLAAHAAGATGAAAGVFTGMYPYEIVNPDGTSQMDVFVTHGQATADGSTIFTADIDLSMLNGLLADATPDDGAVSLVVALDGSLVASSTGTPLVDADGDLVVAAASPQPVVAAAAAVVPAASWPAGAAVAGATVKVGGEKYLMSSTRVTVGDLEWLLCRLVPKDVPYRKWRDASRDAAVFSWTVLGVILGVVCLVGLLVVRKCYVVYTSRFNYQYSPLDGKDKDSEQAVDAGAVQLAVCEPALQGGELLGVATRGELGVVLGKFMPLHAGHVRLLRAAANGCDRLVVLVGDRPGDTIPAAARVSWAREALAEAPACRATVEVMAVTDDLPEAPEPWAGRTLDVLRPFGVPDVVFTCEDYGKPWCELMSARAGRPIRHVRLNKDVPTSGTALRGTLDERASWEFLSGPARAGLCKRVAVVGCESSGTTTLAQALAKHFGTASVPEYGRFYWEGREHAAAEDAWTEDEFVRIAQAQQALEDSLAPRATRVLVCDTEAGCTALWHQRFRDGARSAAVEAVAELRDYDLYIVTAPDFDFVQDGTRVEGGHRTAMHDGLLARLKGKPHLVVGGAPEARLAAAASAVEGLLRWDCRVGPGVS